MIRGLFVSPSILALVMTLAITPGADGSERLTIAEALATRKDHAVFYVALKESGELDALRGANPYTLYAPTDTAFAQLDNITLKKLIEDREYLKKLVRKHIGTGKYWSKDLKACGEVKTLAGTTLKVTNDADGLRIEGAKLVVTDIECRNGVIHVIDIVMLPDN